MDSRLQAILFERYPKLFRQKDLSMRETCMCWGICCGNGWFQIIDRCCRKLTELLSEYPDTVFEFSQIKEKFGTLRLYYDSKRLENIDDVDKLVSDAEEESAQTCEECGDNKTAKLTGKAWFVTLCISCRLVRE